MKKRRLIKPSIAAALVCTVICLVALLIFVILNISPLPFSNTGVPAGFFSYSNISALSFERADGSKMPLSELSGKTVVLVYFTTWCPLCKEGLSRINELADAVADEDAVLLLVNKFDERENRDDVLFFIENNSIALARL